MRLQAERRAERDHGVADAQRLRGAERRRACSVLGLGDVEHGEVVDRAAADDRGLVAVAVLVDDLDRAVVLGGVGDHVVVGDDVALPVEHEAGAGGAAVWPSYSAKIWTVLGSSAWATAATEPLSPSSGGRTTVSTPLRPLLDRAGGRRRARCGRRRRRRRTPPRCRRPARARRSTGHIQPRARRAGARLRLGRAAAAGCRAAGAAPSGPGAAGWSAAPRTARARAAGARVGGRVGSVSSGPADGPRLGRSRRRLGLTGPSSCSFTCPSCPTTRNRGRQGVRPCSGRAGRRR